MKDEKSFGGIVIRKNRNEYEVLIIQSNHTDGKFWGFPKGHPEKNESESETALREIKEETDLDVILLEEISFKTKYKIFKGVKAGVKKEVKYFLCFLTEGEVTIQEEELSDYSWVPLYKAASVLTYDVDIEVIHKLRRKYPTGVLGTIFQEIC